MPIQITNNTPWDNEDLTRVITSHLIKIGGQEQTTQVKVETLNPKPGIKREDQPLVATRRYSRSDSIVIQIASPKRIASRTGINDRLARVDDLKANETWLPADTVATLVHCLHSIDDHSENRLLDYQQRECRHGCCGCVKPKQPYLIRGDTGARVRPAKSKATLEKELMWINNSIGGLMEKVADLQAKAARLRARIEKMEAKG